MSPQRGIELIERQIAEGEALASKPLGADDYTGWRTHTYGILDMVYGSPSSEAATLHNAAAMAGAREPAYPWGPQPFVDEAAERAKMLQAQLVQLSAFVKILKDRVTAATPAETVPVDERAKVIGTKVFLVHGRADVRHEVARFVEKLKLQAIILDEQPNKGMTLIQKFEDHAGEAGFAIVLLTADDVGALAADLVAKKTADEKIQCLRPRGRQNVVFELGYFRAKLGPGHVCLMAEPGVEILSDVSGVVSVSIAGGWQLLLAKELKAASLPVNLNDAV